MGKQKNNVMNWLQYILGIMMTGSFLFFILGQLFFEPENNVTESTFRVFESEWTRLLENGSEIKCDVPGECEGVQKGEWVTIQTILPDKQEDTWICMRSMQQELKIHVGDELRKEYSTLETQPFGKTSTMTYVFFPLYDSDAGKVLRVEFKSDSAYAGYVSDIYTGQMQDMILHFYKSYLPSVMVAILLLLIGIFVICGSIFISIIYKRKVDLLHLGNVMLIAATWLIVESKLRQFLFPNSTVAMLMGFLMIAMLPYPFLSYINIVQNNRYQKVYMALACCTALNFAVVLTLQLLNIRDFFEVMTSSHMIILALIVTMGVTIVLDVIKGYVKEYREVAIGFGVLMTAGVGEIALTYVVDAKLNGIALCVGLVLLLITAGLKFVRDMFNIEKEKQLAVAASENKAKFLANMSHEIRTPINTVIGMNEMILRENKDEDIEEYAYNIKRASEMLLSLVNDVLDFSKMEAGKLQLVESDYYLSMMLNDVVTGIQNRAQKKNLELKLVIDETMPSILKGDEIRIKQILNNLMSNAVKYTEKGSITFLAKSIRDEQGFWLVLAVKDTGIGIKKEDMEKLFDSFQRLELSKNRYIEGTGLGLNITQQLVSIMNGTIDVESEYGKGSCFTVRIPQQVVDDSSMGAINQKRRINRTGKEAAVNSLSIPNAEILAVDDTKMNLVIIRELLKRSQAKLDFADGGNECLERTKAKKYDLILMDHMMPEPDGIQTLHMIRSDENNKNQDTPVVVLTANAVEGMKEQYLNDGFADYLSKPVEADKLEDILAKFLG